MKKRTAVIGAALSLIPMGQPLVIGGGAALTSAAVMLAVPQSAQAESSNYYVEIAKDAMRNNDFDAAIRCLLRQLILIHEILVHIKVGG